MEIQGEDGGGLSYENEIAVPKSDDVAVRNACPFARL